MIKSLLFIIPIAINLIIFFTEQFDKISFIILFNLIIIFSFLLNKYFFKNKTKTNLKQGNEENIDNKQESADDHPIIVSARKRLNK